MKLIVMVVDGADVERLADEMVTAGYPLTKMGSSGGFLRRRSSTLISGVDDAAGDHVVALARRLTRARAEFAPVHQIRSWGTRWPPRTGWRCAGGGGGGRRDLGAPRGRFERS